MVGFLEKLNAQRTENRQEGLVWVGDADLDGFYRKRHPRIVHVRHAGSRRTQRTPRGARPGGKIVLHTPGARRALGRGEAAVAGEPA